MNRSKIITLVLALAFVALSASSCKTTGKMDDPEKIAYVEPVQGIQAQKVGEAYSRYGYHIPYNAQVELIDTRGTQDYNYGQRRIIWNGEHYNVYKYALSVDKDSQYFRIVTKAGLNLRVEPSLKSKIQLVIPFLATGRIVGVHPDTQKIQDRTGYWLQVNYQNKSGWIFSGFVMTGDDPDSIKLENRKLEVYRPELILADDWRGDKEAQKFAEVDGVKLLFYKKPQDDCSKSANIQRTGILIRKADGTNLTIKGDIEEPIKTNFQDPNLIVTYHQHCICCCPNGSYVIYLRQKKEVVPYLIGLGKWEGACGGMGDQVWSETRVTADKTKILMLVKVPICQGTYAYNSEGPPGDSGVSTKNVDYLQGVFVIFDLINGTMQKQDALAVPKEYAPLWNNGFLLVATSQPKL